MNEAQTSFEGWAIVELMGHQRIAGFVKEQQLAGGALVRVDVPAVDDRPAFTKMFGVGAIYGLTPCTEAAATHAVRHFCARPISEWDLPSPRALPAPEAENDHEDEDPAYAEADDEGHPY